MSSESVEMVRPAWEAWARGDLEAVMATFDDEVEWDTTRYEGWPETGIYKGRDAVREFFIAWRDSWDQYEVGVDEYIDAGEDCVVVVAWQRGIGRDSQVPVEMHWAQVIYLRDGLGHRLQVWSDIDAALEAVGVRAS